MKIALVLGSGGARGYAHIGILEELARRGHEITAVAGCSMGAVVGGIWANGKLPEFTEYVRSLKRTDLLPFFAPAIGTPSLIRDGRMMNMLERFTGDSRIEDLSVPTTIVSVDIDAQREVWFTQGPLLPAMRASLSIPSVFPPVVLNGRLLVDGGVLNPLPTSAVKPGNADIVLGISLAGPTGRVDTQRPTEESSEEHGRPLNLRDRLSDFKLPMPSLHKASASPFEPLPDGLGVMSVAQMSVSTMQARIEAARLAADPPDVLIHIPHDTAETFDFHEADRIIEAGRAIAVKTFDEVGL